MLRLIPAGAASNAVWGGVTTESAREAMAVYRTPATVSPSVFNRFSSGDPTTCCSPGAPKTWDAICALSRPTQARSG